MVVLDQGITILVTTHPEGSMNVWTMFDHKPVNVRSADFNGGANYRHAQSLTTQHLSHIFIHQNSEQITHSNIPTQEFAALMKTGCSIRIYYIWDECPNVSAEPDDPSGELRMQPVTCCLSVTKPVKGELIIPAGWFPEASVALGPLTAAWLFDGHLNYSGSWLIMGQPVATLPRPASCCTPPPPSPPPS